MTNTERPLRVFLCHASGDKPAVKKLYQRLIKDGIDAWLDEEKLIPGQDWQAEITKAVKNSDAVIVCLSPRSITKEGFVQREIKFSLDVADEKPNGTIFIIPARLENCDVPERINKFQWVDLSSNNGYERLRKALQIRAENLGVSLPPPIKIFSKPEVFSKELDKEKQNKSEVPTEQSNTFQAVLPKNTINNKGVLIGVTIFLSLIVIFLIAQWIYQQVNQPAMPNVDTLFTRAVRTDSEITIDGLLSESAWSEAVLLTYAIHPPENESSTATVRFLWNNDYLFVGFDVSDTEVETADLSTLWDSDSVSILLHDDGIVEYRQSLGEEQNDDKVYKLKPMTTLNESSNTDSGFTVEMRIRWRRTPQLGKRIPIDLLSVDHDGNPGSKHDAQKTNFSKLSWDGDGDIASANASLLLVER